jgi:peptidyl-prolyl cis-trans isomerase A (cyclophilin A)
VFVLFDTSKGRILLELDPAKAPISVANFMEYVKGGFYDGTVFHRVVPNFVVQGGGFDGQMAQKQTRLPIKNEWTNGLKNAKGTISMARLPSPDSATSQFFLNLKDNAALDGANGPGYAVFGKIVVGMDVLDAMGAVRTSSQQVTDQSGMRRPFTDVPTEPLVLAKASEIPAEEAARMVGEARSAAPATPAPAAPTAPAAPAAPAAK